MNPNDPDSQLVRTTEDGWTNLAVGEPYFLRRHLDIVMPPAPKVPTWPSYPAWGGHPELVKILKQHYKTEHVVVCNGARQALMAAMYALKTKYYSTTVTHAIPHWPSYKSLSELSWLGFQHNINPLNPRTIRIITSPNNPDGRISHSLEECDILDAVYEHPVYGWDGRSPQRLITIHSASKMFGLSGERVGWARTHDETLANLMADYIEKTCSGVNERAQLRVALMMEKIGHKDTAEAYKNARKDLGANGDMFWDLISPYCVNDSEDHPMIKGVPLNGSGMFAFFKVNRPDQFKEALNHAKVNLVSGEACGMEESGWFRMSMGHYRDVTEQALIRLEQELEKQ